MNVLDIHLGSVGTEPNPNRTEEADVAGSVILGRLDDATGRAKVAEGALLPTRHESHEGGSAAPGEQRWQARREGPESDPAGRCSQWWDVAGETFRSTAMPREWPR